MRIGTLTLTLNNNYGGILQAYALIKVLQDMGHEVMLINQQVGNTPLWKYPLKILKRIILKKILQQKNTIIFYEKITEKEKPVINKKINSFIERYLPKTDLFDSDKKLKKGIKQYNLDAIIVGSDQVWRPIFAKKIESFFLSFLEDANITKRISYAASFGTNQWEYSHYKTLICRKLAKKFDAISVREDSAIDLCKKYLHVHPQQVLDPTMLIDSSEYLKLFSKGSTSKINNNLLVYILDETNDKTAVVQFMSQQLSIAPICVNVKTDDYKISLNNRIAPPVEEWVQGFYNAKFVLTDSFHGVAFSILFNKPFIVYGNETRGMARFSSLLSVFDLKNRLITKSKELTEEKLLKEINWDEVNMILRRQREESKKFLFNNLQ